MKKIVIRMTAFKGNTNSYEGAMFYCNVML